MASTLSKLVKAEYLKEIKVNDGHIFIKQLKLNHIDEEIKDQDGMDKKLSRREWRIAITSAVIGGITGVGASYLVSFLAR